MHSPPRVSAAPILWQQVWGLAAILAAVLLCFLTYGFYQPRVLSTLGFAEIASALGIAQGLMGAVIEPLMGRYSDWILLRFGSRLPQITVGVTVAGLLFVILALLLQQSLPIPIRWIIPFLMTLWLMAMIAFRGPVIALLRQFAPTEELPAANAVLIFVFGLVGAIAPLLQLLLTRWGASIAFVVGAIALLIGAYLLYASAPVRSILPSQPDPPVRQLKQIGIVTFAVGLGAGLEMFFLMQRLPPLLSRHLPGMNPELVASVVLLICAIAANPLGHLTVKWGVVRAMLVGLGVTLGLAGLVGLSPSLFSTVMLVLALGLALGLVFISTIPYALSMMPPGKAGLSAGLYFGGNGAATTVGIVWLQVTEQSAIDIGMNGAIAGFILAALGLAASHFYLTRTLDLRPK